MYTPSWGARVLVALWVTACAGGLLLVWRYKARPASAGAPPASWPAGLALTRDAGGPTLIMVAHPRCACTKASLDELEVVLAGAPRGVTAYLVLALPEGVADDWGDGTLAARARSIRGLRVVEDRGSAIAHRLGVDASGHVLVYDAAGVLRFTGGITGARGHRGDNLGRARVLALLRGGQPDHGGAHVFGCAIEARS